MEKSPDTSKLKNRVLGSKISDNSEIQRASNGSNLAPSHLLNNMQKPSLNRNLTDRSEEQSGSSSRTSSSTMSPSKLQNIRESLHSMAMEDKNNETALVNNIEKRSVNLDLLENNQGFSISSSSNSIAETLSSKKLSRSHWKHPSTASVCTLPNCNKSLGLKNGTVNCRKCGNLFCNEHTNYKILLKNSPAGPVYDCGEDGIWSKSCKTCYLNKPDLIGGSDLEPNSKNLMSEFKKKRSVYIDNKLLLRDLIQKKFIKLVNILVQQHYKNTNEKFWSSFLKTSFEIDKNIVGLDNWENDTEVNSCSVCFIQFNFFIRKHHCRLCGKIVCEDTFNERKQCSIIVPLAKILVRIPNLNYSSQVKQNWQNLISNDSITFRCCLNCRDNILYDWKHENINKSSEEELRIFTMNNSLMALKHQIKIILPKYEKSLCGEDLENINKLRNKLMNCLKDFESLTSSFRQNFFVKKGEKMVINELYDRYSRIIINIYQGSILFLSENLSVYKRLTTGFKEKEQERLKLVPEIAIKKPDLTKKQIRELREELMVLNEQKFLIENLIEDYTKMRKFDELNMLKENKQELALKIEELELKLGEFGF